MQAIQATVNERLLAKADRLFTGTLHGRIIEILQNARRAGATQVQITNQDGIVTVRDNGRGIEDFSRLLDLGGSGWDSNMESCEDPAGVGIFCLAPREVTIRSRGKRIQIADDGWIGKKIVVQTDSGPEAGTTLQFADEPWDSKVVDINAVFCGMDVIVDGKTCPKTPFVSENAVHHPELGCRIEVRESQDLDRWHRSRGRNVFFDANALVNFHGQIVELSFRNVADRGLHFLVELTGEPTNIRLMLPARTCLVENDGFEALKLALEIEAYRYLQRKGKHTLPYKQYLRAKELGISLPEAEPTFDLGLLCGDTPQPIEVTKPKDWPLERCFQIDAKLIEADPTSEANVHLLAALGKFETPFVPVSIHSDYDGYSWAKLPKIQKIEVRAGRILLKHWLWSGEAILVDDLRITAQTSDGKTFSSAVCMAVQPPEQCSEKNRVWDDRVYLTKDAQESIEDSDVWYHFGGWYDEGDTYDTQQYQFGQELEAFWANVAGPNELLRRKLLDAMSGAGKLWSRVTLNAEGSVAIQFTDGSQELLKPPPDTSSS